MSEQKTASLSIRISPSLKQALEKRAAAEGRSLANYASRMLEATLEPEKCFNCDQMHAYPALWKETRGVE